MNKKLVSSNDFLRNFRQIKFFNDKISKCILKLLEIKLKQIIIQATCMQRSFHFRNINHTSKLVNELETFKDANLNTQRRVNEAKKYVNFLQIK